MQPGNRKFSDWLATVAHGWQDVGKQLEHDEDFGVGEEAETVWRFGFPMDVMKPEDIWINDQWRIL